MKLHRNCSVTTGKRHEQNKAINIWFTFSRHKWSSRHVINYPVEEYNQKNNLINKSNILQHYELTTYWVLQPKTHRGCLTLSNCSEPAPLPVENAMRETNK